MRHELSFTDWRDSIRGLMKRVFWSAGAVCVKIWLICVCYCTPSCFMEILRKSWSLDSSCDLFVKIWIVGFCARISLMTTNLIRSVLIGGVSCFEDWNPN
ncbi:hypothetical protein HanRHA438_Chr10g0440991 [Helianthus annuus]|nr:hypothetical protein HanOQP8_Chr10g0356581 [Helianthus annuus]KAJ0878546.1 hypothetical protein HanRHA438_Chr10g0440991 [Helianthus annuus]KAJ0882796.1 hypothetical protein HanPSC8_Chr10g0413821 [Helianthus annuus]